MEKNSSCYDLKEAQVGHKPRLLPLAPQLRNQDSEEGNGDG